MSSFTQQKSLKDTDLALAVRKTGLLWRTVHKSPPLTIQVASYNFDNISILFLIYMPFSLTYILLEGNYFHTFFSKSVHSVWQTFVEYSRNSQSLETEIIRW